MKKKLRALGALRLNEQWWQRHSVISSNGYCVRLCVTEDLRTAVTPPAFPKKQYYIYG